jgi:hypothetical protein
MSRASILPQLGGALAIGLLALSALPTRAAAEAEQCDVPFRHATIPMMPESFDRTIAKIADHGYRIRVFFNTGYSPDLKRTAGGELQEYASHCPDLANGIDFKPDVIILVASPKAGSAISLGTNAQRALGSDVSKVRSLLSGTEGDSESEVKMKVGQVLDILEKDTRPSHAIAWVLGLVVIGFAAWFFLRKRGGGGSSGQTYTPAPRFNPPTTGYNERPSPTPSTFQPAALVPPPGYGQGGYPVPPSQNMGSGIGGVAVGAAAGFLGAELLNGGRRDDETIVNNETIINNSGGGHSQGDDPLGGAGAGADAPASTEFGSGAGWNDTSPPAGGNSGSGWDDSSPAAEGDNSGGGDDNGPPGSGGGSDDSF